MSSISNNTSSTITPEWPTHTADGALPEITHPEPSLPPTPEKVIQWTPKRNPDGSIKFLPSPVKNELKGLKSHCIYQLKNEKEGKKYIGSSMHTTKQNIVRRLQKYGRTINKTVVTTSDNNNDTPIIKRRAFRPIEKELRENPTGFTCSILAVYKGTNEEQLKEHEENWINDWRTLSPTKGYNKRRPTTEAPRSTEGKLQRLLFPEADENKKPSQATSDKI